MFLSETCWRLGARQDAEFNLSGRNEEDEEEEDVEGKCDKMFRIQGQKFQLLEVKKCDELRVFILVL